MNKQVLAALAVSALCAVATPAMAEKSEGFVIYSVAGTSGAGLGLGGRINDDVGLRGEFTTLKKSLNKVSGGNTYTGDVEFSDGGLYLDWRPFTSSGFRLTGGVNSSGPKVTGAATADANGKFTVNGVTYAAAGESLSAEVKYPRLMPYVGVGYGLTNFDKPGWKFGVDLGVSVGQPDVTLTASSGLNAMLPQGALDAEKAKVKDALAKDNFWPVAKISIGYSY